MMNNDIKQLKPDDFEIWKKLCLESLKEHPESFGSSFEDTVTKTDDEFKQDLNKNTVFCAIIEGQPVGCVGFYGFLSSKMHHRGCLFGMYIKSDNRKMGLADKLMKTVIDYAKSRVLQIHLTVVVGNQVALKLYEKYGFKIYGTEPRSLKIDDRFYDEHLMVLRLD